MLLRLPYREDNLRFIRPGDEVILSGVLYAARDQAHLRMAESEGEIFPYQGNAVYYMGPSPAPRGHALGAAGPTTSARMDPFSPLLIKRGLKVMIGKGPRSRDVVEAIKKYGGLYLQAFGGCGALYSKAIKKAEIIAYSDLGPEVVWRLEVEDFPTIAVIDSNGETLI